jgi:F-type H+-transporting ATPase subunit alpha
VAGTLRLDLSQYRELAAFAQFGSDLDRVTQAKLARGERMYEVLKQEQYKPMSVPEQVVSLYAAVNGYIDSIAVGDVVRFERELLTYMQREHPEILTAIAEQKEITSEVKGKLDQAISAFKHTFVS